MRKFVDKNLRRVRSAFEPSYPPAWPLVEGDITRPNLNPQRKCPLFAKLSPELRILIYQAVLTDPNRFLHIIRNMTETSRWARKRRKSAHFWCVDMDSKYPTWQHGACYGEHRGVGFGYRKKTETDDKLLSLLLSCRIVYSEALPVLYRENIFHFRGAPGLLAFKSSLSTVQWQSIRHTHISTLFTCQGLSPSSPNEAEEMWPPEGPSNWEKCCQALSEIPNLASLKLDISVQVVRHGVSVSERTDNLLRAALVPLRIAKAKVFEVELNTKLSQDVEKCLVGATFLISLKDRGSNVRLYGTRPCLGL